MVANFDMCHMLGLAFTIRFPILPSPVDLTFVIIFVCYYFIGPGQERSPRRSSNGRCLNKRARVRMGGGEYPNSCRPVEPFKVQREVSLLFGLIAGK
jgi:hypothetical protein